MMRDAPNRNLFANLISVIDFKGVSFRSILLQAQRIRNSAYLRNGHIAVHAGHRSPTASILA